MRPCGPAGLLPRFRRVSLTSDDQADQAEAAPAEQALRGERDPRPLVLIPTYNERENLAAIVAATLDALPAARVLVIDDASPDGTGALADGLAQADARVEVLHRAGKQGLGRAYVDGFRRGLATTPAPTHFISMDADFSHDPGYLAGLVEACHPGPGGADVVVGSRYVRGGGTRDWSFARRMISRAALTTSITPIANRSGTSLNIEMT